ncbi:hypothetical protein MBLNU230_g0258t1 [Neophaeotheca triangularis]
MEQEEPLQRLQNLQRDLVAFTETQVVNVGRLSAELEASIEDLRRLLDHKSKDSASRQALDTGKVTVDEVEYAITEEFKQCVFTVADELDLDEMQAAKLCIECQNDPMGGAGALPLRALLRFHEHRRVLLECLRLLMKCNDESDDMEDEQMAEMCQKAANLVTKGPSGTTTDTSAFFRKCMDALKTTENDLRKIQDHTQTIIMTGQILQGDMAEALQIQRLFLSQQHENLAATITHLIHANRVLPEDFISLLQHLAGLETFNHVMLHYTPVLISGSAQFGSNNATPFEEARKIHHYFAEGTSKLQWKNKHFQALSTVWWLAEYGARFADTSNEPTLRNTNREAEAEARQKLFFECLKDRALHMMLAMCQNARPEIWFDPAKVGLIRFLLGEGPNIDEASVPLSSHIAELAMKELQFFADGFVSHMPDVLRRLRSHEDDMLRNDVHDSSKTERSLTMNLERFILVVAYAYRDSPTSAVDDFWTQKEGNLYGFLRWTSQRLPTIRVAAFCDLLRSLANDEESANHAHRFLLEEQSLVAGKLRKAHSVSWNQIFTELDIYAASIKDRVSMPQPTSAQNGDSTELSLQEPDTDIMLEAYLRLTAHVCRASPDARNWVLREQPYRLHETLLQLVQSFTDPRIRACCFDTLAALMTGKTPEVNTGMWILLESWVSGGIEAGNNAPKAYTRTGFTEKGYLQRIARNPEEATAFVGLLIALIEPGTGQDDTISDALPFPEHLSAASHRNAGIEPYIDFVLGSVFRSTTTTAALGVEDEKQANVLRFVCLRLINTCLSTFNEDLVILANGSNVSVDNALKTASLAQYVCLHPFARVMEYMFNDRVVEALMITANQNADTLKELDVDSPLVQATLKSVETMSLVMSLQTTYLTVVRPIVKTQSTSRNGPVANPALASFEDVILSNLNVIVECACFAAGTHLNLCLASLDLLKKLAASRRLSSNQVRAGNRLVGRLTEVSEVASPQLQDAFVITDSDLEIEGIPPGIIKARAILDLLNNSLDLSPNSPGIAHCLLGFGCQERSVSIAPESHFDKSKSLFHRIAECAATFISGLDNNMTSWLLAVKRGCLDVVLKLASSPMTAKIVKQELRSMDFLSASSLHQQTLLAGTLWDGLDYVAPEVLVRDSASAIRDFLHTRELFFEYAAIDLRGAAQAGALSIQERIMACLLGEVQGPTGEADPAPSVYDLFDFFRNQTAVPLEAERTILADVDLSGCVENSETGFKYSLKMAEELLILRKRELYRAGNISDASVEQRVDDEIQATLYCLKSGNAWKEIQKARLDALEAWAELLALMVTSGGLSVDQQSALTLQTLQLAVSNLEKSLSDDQEASALLARLTLALAQGAGQSMASSSEHSLTAATDLLSTSFRVSLRAITDGEMGLALRDVSYRISNVVIDTCLSRKPGQASSQSTAKQLSQQVQSFGTRLITTITEDAFSGRGATRISALLFLDGLLRLSHLTKFNHTLLQALTKLNFVPVLIDTTIGSVATSFRAPDNSDLSSTLAYFHTALTLLLRFSETPAGAQLLLNAGLFPAVADSRLFSTDPDVGLDIDNPTALREFYKLMSSVLKVVVAVVLTKGPNNAATVQQAKRFLQENRFSMQAVFKRTSAVKNTAGPPEAEAVEVAEHFARLLIATGFMDVSGLLLDVAVPWFCVANILAPSS